MFGVAEDHDSNPLKIGISKLKKRGARFVSVNPVRTGYSAVADNWIGIRPGTDGLLILVGGPRTAQGAQDRRRLSPALFQRALAGDRCARRRRPRAVRARRRQEAAGLRDRHRARRARSARKGARPALSGRYQLADGRFAVPSFQLLAEKYLDPKYAPEAVAAETGVSAATIRGLAAEIARVAFDEAITIDQPWTDMHGERHDELRRPAGLVPCDARHLRPFQRLPDGARAAPAAGADRRGRLPRRLPLRAALSEAGRGASDAARQGRAFRLEQAAVRPASRLSARPGGSADRHGRPAEPHRQGVFLGRAVLGPRADAHGDRQRACRRSVSGRRAVPLHGQHGLELVDAARQAT